MSLELVISKVLNKVILPKYPKIKDFQVIEFSEEYYRIVYFIKGRTSEKLEDEITKETMNLFTMMGIDDNDFGFEFF